MDDHGVVGVDTEDADLKQVAIVGGANAHREVVIELPLSDGVADRVEHVVVCGVCFRAVCAMRTE